MEKGRKLSLLHNLWGGRGRPPPALELAHGFVTFVVGAGDRSRCQCAGPELVKAFSLLSLLGHVHLSTRYGMQMPLSIMMHIYWQSMLHGETGNVMLLVWCSLVNSEVCQYSP